MKNVLAELEEILADEDESGYRYREGNAWDWINRYAELLRYRLANTTTLADELDEARQQWEDDCQAYDTSIATMKEAVKFLRSEPKT